MKWTLLLISLFFSAYAWSASSPAAQMRQAAQVYQQEEYERALNILEGLRASNYASAPLFYNLGNCYYQTGNLGTAILNYERGLLLQPGHKKIQHNLRFARQEVEGNPLPWPTFSLAQTWRRIRGWWSSNTWALLGLLTCWAALAIWWLGRKKSRYWVWNFGALGLAGLTLVLWLLAYSATHALSSEYAVILAEELVVQVGPDSQSGRVSTVFEGWKVKRLDQIGDWVKIELPDGQEGWVQPEHMEPL